MKCAILVLTFGAFALASGEEKLLGLFGPDPLWDNLKVTFGVNPLTSFQSMPRTTGAAKRAGWANISPECTNGGAFNGFRYTLKGSVDLALLFDVNGYIAGIQMILKKSEILANSANQYQYGNVSMFVSEKFNNQDVYTLTTYFVQPESICTTGRTAEEFKAEGTGSQLYFQNGPTPATLINPPTNRKDAIAEGWTKNNCFPMMGYHNFYRVEDYAATNCQQVRPVFLLFNRKGQLYAFGFVAFGDGQSSRFEKPGPTAIKAIVGDSTPQCLVDLAGTVKVTSMHVYFGDISQTQLCVL